jgi:riboflavin biosynthesis pyrimidine reductase
VGVEASNSIGGAGPAAAAIELGLVDELRMFRDPIAALAAPLALNAARTLRRRSSLRGCG